LNELNPEGSIFVLSGEELTLPFAEIRALVDTYSKDATIEQVGKRIAISSLSDKAIVEKITERAAYCRFGGLIVSQSDTMLSLALEINSNLKDPEKTFAIDSFTLSKEKCGELGAAIKSRTNQRVSLEDPDILYQLESLETGFILGVTTQGYKKQSWRSRRPRARRFFLPSAIYPKLARVLVNLSRVREGQIFLDPFCGTGSLLIESAVMGIDSIGIDLTKWISRGAILNLKGFSLDYLGVIRADSTHQLPLMKIGGVATDIPYGRASSTKGKTAETILHEFVDVLDESLFSSSKRPLYCVIMHPSLVKLKFQGNSFQLQEEHLLYVHRNLTRAISVLRKD
jgi:tRNA (guanine10-N2)-dimethyltransferase